MSNEHSGSSLFEIEKDKCDVCNQNACASIEFEFLRKPQDEKALYVHRYSICSIECAQELQIQIVETAYEEYQGKLSIRVTIYDESENASL